MLSRFCDGWIFFCMIWTSYPPLSMFIMILLLIMLKISRVSVCLSVGPVSESHSLLILGWWSSLPRASDIWTLDSVPMFKFLLYSLSWWFWSPPSPPPSKIHPGSCPPGHLSRLLSTFVLFASSPSISVYSAAPLQQRLVLRRPSVGGIQPTGWRPTKVLSWFHVQRPNEGLYPPPPTCAAGGTWLACGHRGEGDGAPCDGLESLDASAGNARVSVPYSTLKLSLRFLQCPCC